jgi:multiple sugar transport system ATP-binding protein
LIGEEIIASLVVKNLAKSFAGTKVLDDVSFAVADGEFCVLLGPSGCGKTTLLRIVAGLETASSGEIQIDTARVNKLQPSARDVAFVFQNYALYPHMTVFENLGFALRLQKVPKIEIQDRVAEVARLLEIDKQLQQKPQQLSGGQRQRVALGRAIVRRPKLFLFDEPLSNLDATLRASMRVELAKLHERLAATMLYVTHDQAEAMTLGEKIIVLNRGSIQQAGKPSDIYHRPANAFVAGFVGHPRMNLFEGRLNEGGTALKAGGFEIDLPAALSDFGGADRRAPVTVGIRPEDLVPCDPREAWFSGTADFVEDLGSDRFVHLSCRNLRLVARLPARFPIQRGDPVNLRADFERVHLFHKNQRLR